MNLPDVRYYARFEYNIKSGSTPKYTAVAETGYYPPMDALIGKDGQISLYLTEKLASSTKSSTPPMRLQAKSSLNLTGLKDYYDDGKISGFAHGCPPDERTYSAKEKANPFYEYRNDAFLFIFYQKDAQNKTMISGFDFIVLADAKPLAATYCKMLKMGGFDEVLRVLRKQGV